MPRFKDVMGRYPFEAKDKKPMLLQKHNYFHYLYPPNNAATSDTNYLIVSTDTLLLGIYELPPGGSFDPIDIHPGDEAYYILNGPIVQRNANGQFVEAQTGDGMLVPRECWHKAYNFTDQKARVLYFIAPKAWDENIPPAVVPTDAEMKMYKGAYNDKLPNVSPIPDFIRPGTTDDIGQWPVDGKMAREGEPRFVYRVSDENKLVNIHGAERPMLMKFWVSNDLMHMGEMILPAGGYGPRASEVDSHEGDCALYIVDGPITVNMPEIEEAFIAEPEDSVFIPAGTKYQLVNFEAKPSKAIFAIAPKL